MKYENLRQKTIFDICSDKKILDEIILPEDKDFFIENVNYSGRAMTFLELAELTNNSELEKAVMKQFKQELTFDE